MKDTITLGVASGIIGNIAKDISNFLLWRSKKTELLYAHLTASTLVGPGKTNEPFNLLLGQIQDMTYGAALGIPLVYLLKLTGKDNYLLKGAGTGLLLWSVLYNFGPIAIQPKMTKTHFSALWNNLLYGMVTAHAAVSLADPDVFPKSN